MQALTGFPAVFCPAVGGSQGNIRRHNAKAWGSTVTCFSSRTVGDHVVCSTARPTWDVLTSQHSKTRLWTRTSASEDETVSVLEGEEGAVEAAPAPEIVEKEEDVPTVKVKFVLQKECRFGQQFNVVGDNSYLGEWNVDAAVPLDWSEGHVWTREVDVPAGKVVEYKFLLTGKRGELEWQPGVNRSFETPGEGGSSLVVTEKWGGEEEEVEAPAAVSAAEEAAAEVISEAQISEEAVEPEVPAVSSEAQLGEENGQPPVPVPDASSVEETAPELPLVDLGLASAAVEVISEEVGNAAASLSSAATASAEVGGHARRLSAAEKDWQWLVNVARLVFGGKRAS